MNIEVIDTLDVMQGIRERWDLIYERDSSAQFFISWVWITGCLEQQAEAEVPWLILAAKPSSDHADYVAFLPLIVTLQNDDKLGLYSQFKLAGITDSHYPGFICLPRYEDKVIVAFSEHLQDHEIWSVVELQHIQPNSSRWCHFLSHFSENEARIVDALEQVYKDELDGIDNSICPYIPLPNDWETYVQGLGASTRKNLRKKLKRFAEQCDTPNGCRIVYANAENIEMALDALLSLWQANWEGRKGTQQCIRIAESWRSLLKHCFDYNCLYLPILLDGNRPVGAVAHFVDRSQRTLLSFVSARDETFSEFSPGLILHAEAIRYAIEQGFETYDFLMGNEAYKYSFGVQERYITTAFIHRRDWIHQAILLNPRNIPEAISIAQMYHREGHLEEAKKRYQQILATDPQQIEVLYNLAVLLQRQGNYPAAKSQFQQLLELEPENTRVWFSLGALYQQQKQLSAAVEAYRQALRTTPELDVVTLVIYLNLGYALQEQGVWDEAIAYYQRARELDPASAEAEVMWANALYALEKLPADDVTRYAEMNVTLGHKRRQSNDIQSALDYYRQAVAMQPDWAEAYYYLGLTLQASEDFSWTDVITCYQKAQSLVPDSAEIGVNLARAQFAQGQLPPEEQERYAVMIYDLATRQQQQGRWDIAAEYFRSATALKPDWPEAHYWLGMALQKANPSNLEEVITCYQTARAIDPNLVKADISLANARFEQGTLPLEQLPFYAHQNHELGHQYRQDGELQLAIDHYRQAIAMAPNLAAARDSLRLALQKQSSTPIKVSVAKQPALNQTS